MFSFEMKLDDHAVGRYYGERGKLGVPIPGMYKRVTAGVRWNVRKGDWEPDDNVVVAMMMTIVRLGPNRYLIECDDCCHERVVSLLQGRCMLRKAGRRHKNTKTRKPVKKPRYKARQALCR